MAQAIQHLRSITFLAGIPPAAAEELASLSQIRRYEDGQRVYGIGDKVPGIFVVVRGSLKIFRTDGRGHVQVLDFLKAGQCVGEVPVFDGSPIASNAEAHGETELWLVPADALRRVAHRTPEVAEAMIQHFAGKIRHLVSLVDALSLHSVPERVAQLLLEEQVKNPTRTLVEFAETQEDLAQCIGASREAFSRALRLLTDLGLIQSTFPVVRILDVPKLQRYAKG
ncbi:MAG TPA: Crp/Fnr family transcriptional regulator [Holophagaceae bacterium]|nr:Crp/Fnr family transcriptional regulator [Holophagaceae bacterium]